MPIPILNIGSGLWNALGITYILIREMLVTSNAWKKQDFADFIRVPGFVWRYFYNHQHSVYSLPVS